MADLTDDDLTELVSRLSGDAFSLAQATATRGGTAVDEVHARELNDRLDELWPRIEAASTAVQPILSLAWTDARLDLGYVLSGGALPTSTRMHAFLAERTAS